MTPITVLLSGNPKYQLALRFPYDRQLLARLKEDFGGEVACIRWNPDSRAWWLKKSQWDALCAAYGAQLSVAYDVLAFVYPRRGRR